MRRRCPVLPRLILGQATAPHPPLFLGLAKETRESKTNRTAKWPLSAAHKTQRSGPGQAHDRRQYKQYGKVVQRRQEGFVSGAYWRPRCPMLGIV